MKRLLRPFFNRIARSLGISDLQTIASQLDQRLTANLQRLDENLATQTNLRREMSETERLIIKQTEDRIAVITTDVTALTTGVTALTTGVTALTNDIPVRDAATRDLTARIDHLREELYQHIDSLTSTRLEASSSAVIEHAKNHAEQLSDMLRRQVDTIVAQLRRDVDAVRGLSTQPQVVAPLGGVAALTTPIVDEALYVALEDRFRGEQKTIRERQRSYVPLIEAVDDQINPVLDFGCGRGEWLEILRDSGITARGVDSNRVCVHECTQKGLDVVRGDLFEVLDALADSSARAVTFFQVFEHLPFSRLPDVLRAFRLVLVPGGVLIAEMSITENLTVAASTFWIDPTHERPLHPLVLKFLAEQTGFDHIQGVYSSPLVLPEKGLEDGSSLDIAVSRIHNLVYGPADFALVATA